MRILTAEQMKQTERNAAEKGVSYTQMMENAGLAAADVICERFSPQGMHIHIYAGRGNNGGDGFVAARRLAQVGAEVTVILVEGEPKTTDSIRNRELLNEIPGLRVAGLDEELPSADLAIDAVYGTGFHGRINKNAARAAERMNHSNNPVISFDLPSGVNSDSGEADPRAVRAALTIAFDSKKPAHELSSANCGEVICVDIGIPEDCHPSIEKS